MEAVILQLHKPYALQRQGEQSESCRQARALFLDRILDLRPHVVTDLWDTSLPEFRRSVIRCFLKRIFEGIDNPLEYLDAKFNAEIEVPSSLVNHRWELKKEIVGLQAQCGQLSGDLTENVNRVTREHYGAFYNRLLLNLLQSRLEPAAAEPHPVQIEFSSWCAISRKRAYKTLCATIRDWSIKWNLNADWCRDHALAALCEWLVDRKLGRVDPYFHPLERSVQSHGWTSATSKVVFKSLGSRLDVDNAVLGVRTKLASRCDLIATPWLFCYPAPTEDCEACFSLSLESFWNIAKESEADFKRRIHLDFRISLAEAEATWLRQVKEQEKLQPSSSKKFDGKLAWRKGALENFEQELKEFVAKMDEKRQAAKSEHGLVDSAAVSQDDLVRNIEWLLRYQLPDNNGKYESQSDIAESCKLALSTVSQAVDELLDIIDIPKRPPLPRGGRKLGSKNKPSADADKRKATSQILRELAR
jgi:hypothetical protein